MTNGGSAPAFNVVASDALPAGVTFLNAQDSAFTNGFFTCAFASGVVTCSGGTLDGVPSLANPAGPLGAAYPESRTILINVLAPNQHNLSLINTARVDPSNAIPEGDETNNAAGFAVTAKSYIDLKITKNGPQSQAQSTELDYTIVVTNDKVGPGGIGENALGVRVHDALPVGLIVLNAFTENPNANNFNCQVQESPVNVVDCLGDLGAGLSVTIKVHAFVTLASGTLDNEACVDPQNSIIESNELNNCSNSTLTVGAPDIAVTKSAVHNPVSPGQDQVYTINATNIGTVAATSVTITDTLESGQTFVSAIGTNGFTCTNVAAVVPCTHTASGDALGAGASTAITLTAHVPDSATGPFHNCASSTSAPGDANTTNDQGCVTTSVSGAGVDLQLIDVTDIPDPVAQGGVLTYTTRVLNSGTATAGLEVGKPVVVRSVISTGLNSVNAIASEGFTCAPSGDSPITIDCTSPATGFEAGHTVTVTITALVNPGAPTNVTNAVTVDPSNFIVESNETNNDFMAATSVVPNSCPAAPPGDPCIDLIVGTILATPDPVAHAGGFLSYTVTVGNAGNVATNTDPGGLCGFFVGTAPNDCAVVEIDFPSQVAYNSGSVAASSGWTCDETTFAPSVVCGGDLGAAAGVVISFSGTVTASASDTFTTTVTAFLFSNIVDFNTANNSNSVLTTAN